MCWKNKQATKKDLLLLVLATCAWSVDLCRFLGATFKGFDPVGRSRGASCLSWIRPFSSARDKWERQATASQSQVHLHLSGFTRSWPDQRGPCIRMWRALVAKFVVLLFFCTLKTHAQGKPLFLFTTLHLLCEAGTASLHAHCAINNGIAF